MKQSRFFITVAVILTVVWMLVFTPAISATGEGAVGLSTVNGTPGGLVDVTVNFENNPGIASAILTVTFPKELTLVTVTDGGKLGAQMHNPHLTSPYILCWANDTATTNFTENGTMATLTFAISAEAQSGTYPITVSYDFDNYDILDVDSNRLRFSLQNGAVHVTADTTIEATTTEATTTEATTIASTTTESTSVSTATVTVSSAPAATTITTTVAVPPNDPSDNTVWWAVLGAVILLLATTGIWIGLKNRK